MSVSVRRTLDCVLFVTTALIALAPAALAQTLVPSDQTGVETVIVTSDRESTQLSARPTDTDMKTPGFENANYALWVGRGRARRKGNTWIALL